MRIYFRSQAPDYANWIFLVLLVSTKKSEKDLCQTNFQTFFAYFIFSILFRLILLSNLGFK